MSYSERLLGINGQIWVENETSKKVIVELKTSVDLMA